MLETGYAPEIESRDAKSSDRGEPVPTIFPQAVSQRRFYADCRRFARISGVFMLNICIFTHFPANFSEAESLLVLIHTLFVCLVEPKTRTIPQELPRTHSW